MSENPKDAQAREDEPKNPNEQGQGAEQDGSAEGGQVSEGPNSLSGSAADQGGADAIPDKTTGPGTSNQQH